MYIYSSGVRLDQQVTVQELRSDITAFLELSFFLCDFPTAEMGIFEYTIQHIVNREEFN